MSHTLFPLSQDQIDALLKNPDTIGEIHSANSFDTYVCMTLNYFLAGEEEQGLLSEVLGGCQSVECSRLECAYFCVVAASKVSSLANALSQIEMQNLKTRVLEADLEEIMDGEVYEELEMASLFTPEETANEVVEDLVKLQNFYAQAARDGLGIVMYTH